ncbi:hypothetical protein [Paludibacter sp.]|uniref:hypothetical protein n=1 Tax=Paludibacter sp. TaxID=1898105 RepID=UPI001355BCA1|nr:hypothetical protein [Paludibacter sp.]MTK53934.1 hypothetical protein [Paludibacter sp.]
MSKICYARFGTALSGEPKNKRDKREIVHCLRLLTKGGSEFGQFSLVIAGFLSKAGTALNFLLPFSFKAKRKSGSQGRKPRILILKAFFLLSGLMNFPPKT